ncbi:MAG: hypothetical protein ABIP85_00340 [Chthoniobacteraceae bacterium]
MKSKPFLRHRGASDFTTDYERRLNQRSLVHVSDFQQMYFVRIFKVSLSDLLPNVDPNEKIGDFLSRAMHRKKANPSG